MRQSLKNKLSTFIGIILLLFIIGCTIFANVFGLKTKEQAKKEYDWKMKLAKQEYTPLKTNDLVKFWNLENLQTDSIKIDYDKKRTLITIINCGILDFSHSYSGKYIMTFEDFLVKGSVKNHNKLTEIGNLFIKYQIQSIHTKTQLGDFTRINFKDGRSVFLVKKNAKLEEEYKRILGKAQSLNDSTKLLYSN
ncbi:hypothetical protein V9L05_22325 (plasmid) [Bernardetia sp. Wsw4-3y2]|uniref:hypothetical protein n=1 Tax=Bernardetia sp. Wsw4-3y2 TaxID=3127471 RepID=UPI0030D06A02